jgi:hypothetical protein
MAGTSESPVSMVTVEFGRYKASLCIAPRQLAKHFFSNVSAFFFTMLFEQLRFIELLNSDHNKLEAFNAIRN